MNTLPTEEHLQDLVNSLNDNDEPTIRWVKRDSEGNTTKLKKVGVFSSRSPFRPNPIGISAVKYIEHYKENGKLHIKIGGLDFLDGTPVLDIKPYIPYADSIPKAVGGYASEKPQSVLSVKFSKKAESELKIYEAKLENLRSLITEAFSLDPRPAWRVKTTDPKQYGVTLYNINIKFEFREDVILITALHKAA